MLHRIREAMQDKSSNKLGGEVDVDETFIGGKSRNMHRSKRERVITGTGGKDNTGKRAGTHCGIGETASGARQTLSLEFLILGVGGFLCGKLRFDGRFFLSALA
jgi:hypothetical protein